MKHIVCKHKNIRTEKFLSRIEEIHSSSVHFLRRFLYARSYWDCTYIFRTEEQLDHSNRSTTAKGPGDSTAHCMRNDYHAFNNRSLCCEEGKCNQAFLCMPCSSSTNGRIGRISNIGSKLLSLSAPCACRRILQSNWSIILVKSSLRNMFVFLHALCLLTFSLGISIT